MASHVISENVLTLNAEGVAVGEELLPSDGNRVERNTIEGSGGAGLLVADSSDTVLTFNDVRESNGPGADLDLARDTIVRGNDLRGNAGGIALSESTGSVIEFNDAGGARGTGIALESGSIGNEIVSNTANGSTGEGIAVDDSAVGGVGNLIERNTADANGGDGIMVTGVGHEITANRAQLNGGWGIYAPAGAIDGGGNFAAGNLEPSQCVGVVCELGEVPGAPNTTIKSGPPQISHSRNASFIYEGDDDVTRIEDLVFECRLDSTNDQAWEDCDYPHDVMNLAPGPHRLEIRAVDLNELADPTPARHDWTYVPLPPNDPPEAFVDRGPRAETWALNALFTFHSDEPDVTFECRVDTHPYEPCGFEGAAFMQRGGFEWGLEETEVGPHTFRVRATDFEGNVGQPATYTWSLLGVATSFLSGPGFTPGTEGEPASGGESTSSDATIDFIANVADATYECSLDLAPFTACVPPVSYTGLALGDHELRVVATGVRTASPRSRPRSTSGRSSRSTTRSRRNTSIERAPETGTSATQFEFTGFDNLVPASQLTYECRLDSTNALDWQTCTSPYNLLDDYTYEDIQMAPGPHVFEVRALDEFDNADPTPARHEWTSVADTSAPGTAFLAGPTGKVGDAEATFEFAGSDNATPDLSLEYECSLDGAPYEPCDVARDADGRDARRAHVQRARGRPRRQRRRDARHAHVGARGPADHHDHVRAERHGHERARDLRVQLQPARRDVRVLDGRRRLRAVHVAARRVRRRDRRPPLRGPRRQRDHDGGRRADRRGPGGVLRVDRRARRRRHAPGHRDHVRAAVLDARRVRHVRLPRRRQPHAARAARLRVLARRRGRSTAALRPRSTRTSRAASTSCWCAPSTRPATSTRRRPGTSGRSRRRPCRPCSPARARCPRARARRSPSPPTCPARRTSAGSTGRRARARRP